MQIRTGNIIIKTFKNNMNETMYKLIELTEHGEEIELARLDYIQLKNLRLNIDKNIKS